jgi:hypothetical protein
MASSSRRIEVDKIFEMCKLKMEDMLIDLDLWDDFDENVSSLVDPT